MLTLFQGLWARPYLFTGCSWVASLGIPRLPLATLWSPAAASRVPEVMVNRSATKDWAMSEAAVPPGQASWLGWIPLPALILAADGSAVAVNPAWATVLPVAADGDGWVEAVERPFRSAFRARLRLAVAAGEPGSADCRVTGPDGGRWSRWWWHPAPPQNLIVCVGVFGDGRAGAALPGPGDTADQPAQVHPGPVPDVSLSPDIAMAVVNRIFEAGLALQSAASLLEGPMATVILRALDDLDRLVRQIRSAVLEPRGRSTDPPHQPL